MNAILKKSHCILTYLASFVLFSPLLGAQILYEREVSSQEKQRYQITYWNESLPADKSEEQLRMHILATDWAQDWTVVKVELLKDKNSAAWFSRINALGRDNHRLAKEAEWKTSAAQHLLLGKERLQLNVNGNKQTFTANQHDLGFNDDPLSLYFPDEEFVGRVYENFRSADGWEAGVTIFETLTHDLTANEFLRLLMPYTLTLNQSQFGPVIHFSNVNPMPASKSNQVRSCCISGVAWISGKNRAVYITTNGAKPVELATHYADKFPSSLSPSVSLDKNSWALNELQMGIKRLNAALKAKQSGPVDWYVFHLNRLISHVYLPFPTLEVAYSGDEQARRKLVRSIKNWFSNNKNNIQWDEFNAMLVAKE